MGSHHKTELIIVERVGRVLHDFRLELRVGARHEVNPHEGIRGSEHIFLGQRLALHHRHVQLLSPIVVPDLRAQY